MTNRQQKNTTSHTRSEDIYLLHPMSGLVSPSALPPQVSSTPTLGRVTGAGHDQAHGEFPPQEALDEKAVEPGIAEAVTA